MSRELSNDYGYTQRKVKWYMTLYGRLSNDSQENSNEIRRLYRFRESTTPTEQSTLPFIVNGLT